MLTRFSSASIMLLALGQVAMAGVFSPPSTSPPPAPEEPKRVLIFSSKDLAPDPDPGQYRCQRKPRSVSLKTVAKKNLLLHVRANQGGSYTAELIASDGMSFRDVVEHGMLVNMWQWGRFFSSNLNLDTVGATNDLLDKTLRVRVKGNTCDIPKISPRKFEGVVLTSLIQSDKTGPETMFESTSGRDVIVARKLRANMHKKCGLQTVEFCYKFVP